MKICAIGDPQSVHVEARIRSVTAHGCSVVLFSEAESEKAPTVSFSALMQLIDEIGKVSVDIVHVHYAANRTAWATLMQKKFPPVIVTVMGGDVLDDEQVPLSFPARWMTHQLLKYSHVVTVKTAHLNQAVKSAGVTSNRIVDLMWGIDPYYFLQKEPAITRKTLGFSENDWVIFSPRSLKPFYNHHLILDAVHAAKTDGVQIRIVFTGYNEDQAYRLDIGSQAQTYGLSNSIVFLDAQKCEGMADIYALSDLVVSLAPSDGFPQSILEAMAVGACCIVTRLEYFSDILIDGKNAIMTGLTADEIKSHLEAIMISSKKRQEIGTNAKQTALKIGSIDASAARMKQIYDGTLKQSLRRPPAIVRLTILAIFLMWTFRDVVRSGLQKNNGSAR